MAAKSKKIRQASPEERESKALRAIATATGLPDAQFDPKRIKRIDTPQQPGEQRIAHETVRKLTQAEMLQRKGLIEPHEEAACEWYASAYALGYETVGCTANWGGAGGGGAIGLGISPLIVCPRARLRPIRGTEFSSAWV